MRTFLVGLLFAVMSVASAGACDAGFPQGIHGRNIRVYVNTFSTSYDSKANGSEEGREYMQGVFVKALNFIEQDAKSPDTFIEAKDIPNSDIVVNIHVAEKDDVYTTDVKTFRTVNLGKNVGLGSTTLFTAEGDPYPDPAKSILSAYYVEGQFLRVGWKCQ